MMIISIEDASFMQTSALQEGPFRLKSLIKIMIIIYKLKVQKIWSGSETKKFGLLN